MKWKPVADPKAKKALVSQCGAYHLCAVLLDGVDHYMAWHHHQIIASGYDKARVIAKVNEHAQQLQRAEKPRQQAKGFEWFTGGEDAQIK